MLENVQHGIFDGSESYVDEVPPLADVPTEPWVESAFEIAEWVLRGN